MPVTTEAMPSVVVESGYEFMTHEGCLTDCIEAGADLPMVKLLCAHGAGLGDARRGLLHPDKGKRESYKKDWPKLAPAVRKWLKDTASWTTPLHHVEFLSTKRVRDLLAKGADVHARHGSAGAPTPLSLAYALLQNKAKAHGHAGAQLIIDAAGAAEKEQAAATGTEAA